MRRGSVRPALYRLAGRLTAGSAPSGPMRRLLVIKPDHFGDVLLAGPALWRLRRRFPAAEITLAVGPRGLAAAHRLPGADKVISVAFPGLDPEWQPSIAARWLLLANLARRWRGRFDAGLVLRDDFYWGAMLLAAAGIPRRAGTASGLCAPFLTDSIPPVRRPAAAHHLRVAALLTGDDPEPDFWTPAHALRFVARDLGDQAAAARSHAGLGANEPYILLHPGSGAAIKLWTPERWAATLRVLHHRLGLRALVLAGRAESHLLPPILRHAGPAALALPEAPSLDLLASLLQGAQLALGVDSGPLHLAAALDTPSVRLYGPVDPLVYGPWGDPRRHRSVVSTLLCAPCHQLHWDRLELPWHPCVRRIRPDLVAEAALAALGHG